MKKRKRIILAIAFAFILFAIVLTGCTKDQPYTPPLNHWGGPGRDVNDSVRIDSVKH